MSTCRETNDKVYGVILSHNTCHNISFVGNGKAEEAKKSFSSDWAENLVKSDKGSSTRSKAEGVEKQLSAECNLSVSTSIFSVS